MTYSTAKIYKIYNSVDDDFYIGSSCISLANRMAKHRYSAQNEKTKHFKLYCKMNDIGIDKFFIQLLEEYPCDNIEQLRKREGEYIQELKPVLNTQIAGRTLQEWRKDNVEKKRAYDKERRAILSDELKEYRKKYYTNNREDWLGKVKCKCGMVICKSSLARHQKRQVHLNAMEQL